MDNMITWFDEVIIFNNNSSYLYNISDTFKGDERDIDIKKTFALTELDIQRSKIIKNIISFIKNNIKNYKSFLM